MYNKTIITIIIFSIFSIAVTAAEFTQQELAYMPATLQIALYKQGILSPTDVIKAQIKQFKKSNNIINAATYTHFEDALKKAKIAEKRYQHNTNRPLEGISIGLKDEHVAKGMIVTQGSLIYKDSPPSDHTDEMTQKLLNAGAIILMQTTVPEFYLSFATNTKAWGVTRNPWNPKYTVGGSSGGSGAALASGYVTLATGSDMAGSIRIPAALNGLYGYKPPFGEVYTDIPFSYFSGTGALARNFSDLVLMRNTIAGPTLNGLNVKPFQPLPQTYKELKGLKIAYIGGMGISEPVKSTEKEIFKALQILKDAGATVDSLPFNINLTAPELASSVSRIGLSGSLSVLFTKHANNTAMMTDYAAGFIKNALNGKYDREVLAEMEETVKALYNNFSKNIFAKGYDIIITPTLLTSHIPAEIDPVNDILIEDGRELPKFCGVLYTIPFNLLNWLPVISVPAGLTPKDMPVGMQIIGKPHDTLNVFRVASWYSKKAQPLFRDKYFPHIR